MAHGRHVARPGRLGSATAGIAGLPSGNRAPLQPLAAAAALLLPLDSAGSPPNAGPMGAWEGAAVLLSVATLRSPSGPVGHAAAAAVALRLPRSSAGRPPCASPLGARGGAALPLGLHVACNLSHSWRAAAAVMLLPFDSAGSLPYASPTGARGGAAVLLHGRRVARHFTNGPRPSGMGACALPAFFTNQSSRRPKRVRSTARSRARCACLYAAALLLPRPSAGDLPYASPLGAREGAAVLPLGLRVAQHIALGPQPRNVGVPDIAASMWQSISSGPISRHAALALRGVPFGTHQLDRLLTGARPSSCRPHLTSRVKLYRLGRANSDTPKSLGRLSATQLSTAAP